MTYVRGNIKAIVPLFRERLTCDEASKSVSNNLVKFKRGDIQPIQEKQIFGILTQRHVGYVPNIKVNFTENAETFCQDTYKFQSMRPMQTNQQVQGLVNVNLIEEHYREKVVNEYEPLDDDRYDFPIDNICTVQQLEIFYRSLILDLYRRESEVDFSFRNDGSDKIDKRYFIVPLKLVEQPLDLSHINAEG